MHPLSDQQRRARGCLMGQLIGDALGSAVEFQTPAQIIAAYPDGVRTICDGGTWNTLAGQPTDDSEMALLLARSLVAHRTYDAAEVFSRYQYWLTSAPFDCGNTIAAALQGQLNPSSQANGALMRVSPLGIFGAQARPQDVAHMAALDAQLTHPHPVCVQANQLFALALAHAIAVPVTPGKLYRMIVQWAHEMNVDASLLAVITAAADQPPGDCVHNMGWVLVALQIALYQLVHAESVEQGVVDTVGYGGDTDTNAAICAALLGAVHGVDHFPLSWQEAVLNCRPQSGTKGVHRPRPECFWPVDALELADKLLAGARS